MSGHAVVGLVHCESSRIPAGENDTDDTRIVPRILAVAAGSSPCLVVNGDGSAVRDYLHIDDAARAFEAAVMRIPEPGRCRKYNIGSDVGISVNELVSAARHVTGRSIPVEHRPAVSEPQRLISDSSRALRELGWVATASDIDTIMRNAWFAHVEGRQR